MDQSTALSLLQVGDEVSTTRQINTVVHFEDGDHTIEIPEGQKLIVTDISGDTIIVGLTVFTEVKGIGRTGKRHHITLTGHTRNMVSPIRRQTYPVQTEPPDIIGGW